MMVGEVLQAVAERANLATTRGSRRRTELCYCWARRADPAGKPSCSHRRNVDGGTAEECQRRSEKIAPAKFAHAVLRTTRFKEMIDWYRTVLNAKIAYENNFLVFMTYDDEHHRIAIAAFPGSDVRRIRPDSIIWHTPTAVSAIWS